MPIYRRPYLKGTNTMNDSNDICWLSSVSYVLSTVLGALHVTLHFTLLKPYGVGIMYNLEMIKLKIKVGKKLAKDHSFPKWNHCNVVVWTKSPNNLTT